MCSKCNGILNESKPRSAIELLNESEARKKKRENKVQSEEGNKFIWENFR